MAMSSTSRSAHALLDVDMLRFTPPVVNKHSETPSFLLTGYSGVLVCSHCVEAPSIVTLESSIGLCSHVSVEHVILASLYSHWVHASASSSSILFAKDCMFPMMIATQGLKCCFFINHLTLTLLVVSSSGPLRFESSLLSQS